MKQSTRTDALYDRGWSFRTLELSPDARFPGWNIVEPDLLRGKDGRLLWFLNAPARRTRLGNGWFDIEEVESKLTQDGDEALLRTRAPGSQVDAVELRGEVAEAFDARPIEPMHLFPLDSRLGGPRDLGSFLLEGQVVARADARAGPSEQLALSIYRIARLRGGPFWEAAGAHIAEVVSTRVERAGDRGPIHSYWGAGETHLRQLADTLLLLIAAAEVTEDARYRRLAEMVADLIEGFGVPWGGGVWYLHDSLEREAGRNDLILNTHLHAIMALIAAGRAVSSARLALATALALRCRRPGAYLHAAAIAATDIAGALTLRPRSEGHLRYAMRARGRAARFRARHPHLCAPGGWIARGLLPRACPLHYTLVNLSDLAMLNANLEDRSIRGALRAGLRYAHVSGYLRAQRRRADPTVALIPGMLRAGGHPSGAGRAADRLAAAGLAPAIGWPGYEDHLWSRLVPGTP